MNWLFCRRHLDSMCGIPQFGFALAVRVSQSINAFGNAPFLLPVRPGTFYRRRNT
jgi:hypothetical protein